MMVRYGRKGACQGRTIPVGSADRCEPELRIRARNIRAVGTIPARQCHLKSASRSECSDVAGSVAWKRRIIGWAQGNLPDVNAVAAGEGRLLRTHWMFMALLRTVSVDAHLTCEREWVVMLRNTSVTPRRPVPADRACSTARFGHDDSSTELVGGSGRPQHYRQLDS